MGGTSILQQQCDRAIFGFPVCFHSYKTVIFPQALGLMPCLLWPLGVWLLG